MSTIENSHWTQFAWERKGTRDEGEESHGDIWFVWRGVCAILMMCRRSEMPNV